MKKRVGIFIITLCMCLGLFCPQVAVFAASGKTSVSASASSVNIGDTVTITGNASGASGEKVLTTMTLSWDAGILQFVSCSVDSNGGGGSRVVNGDSFTITLKAISAGTSSISLSATDGVLFDTVESLDSMAGSSTSVTVNNAAGSSTAGGNAGGSTSGENTAGGNAGGSTSGENTAGGNAGGSTSGENTAGGNAGGSTSGENTAGGSANTGKTLSGDNSLKSLTISPGTLSPSFSGSTTSYTAAVGNDVTSVAVSATPTDDGAVVASVTGNDNLSEGTNTVKIVVKAENGVTATYTIKVTKQAQSASAPEDTAPKEDETETETETETEADTDDSRESITVNGAAYQIAEDFSKEDIPADFMESTIHYHQNTYFGVSFMKGSLNLLWMVSQNAGDTETAKGKFFVYDEMRDSVYPFVRFSNGEKYVIALLAPVDFTMPENYQQTSLAVDEENTITAYQRITEDESEIESEFYIFYGVNHEGTEGWYQYDALEGTYQRLSVKITEEEKAEAGDELAVLQEEYDELLQQYKDATSSARTAMAVLCIVIGVLILIIVNLLVHRFRNRGNGGFMDDDFADDEEDDFPEHTPMDREFTLKNEIGGKSDTADRMSAELNRELDIAMRDRFGNDGDDNTENVREEAASQPLAMPEHEAADEKDDLEIIDFNDL